MVKKSIVLLASGAKEKIISGEYSRIELFEGSIMKSGAHRIPIPHPEREIYLFDDARAMEESIENF